MRQEETQCLEKLGFNDGRTRMPLGQGDVSAQASAKTLSCGLSQMALDYLCRCWQLVSDKNMFRINRAREHQATFVSQDARGVKYSAQAPIGAVFIIHLDSRMTNSEAMTSKGVIEPSARRFETQRAALARAPVF